VVLFRHHQLTFELDDEKLNKEVKKIELALSMPLKLTFELDDEKLNKEVKKIELALSMPLKHRGVVEVWLHLTSALNGLCTLVALHLGNNTITH